MGVAEIGKGLMNKVGNAIKKAPSAIKRAPNEFQEGNKAFIDGLEESLNSTEGIFQKAKAKRVASSTLDDGSLKRSSEYHISDVDQQVKNFIAEARGARDKKALGDVYDKYGIKHGKGISQEKIAQNVNRRFAAKMKLEDSFMDSMYGNRVVHAGAALAFTTMAAGAAISSDGSKSNAELYSVQ